MDIDWRQLNGNLSTDSRVRRKGVAEVKIKRKRERGRKSLNIVEMTNYEDNHLAFKLNGPNMSSQYVVGPRETYEVPLPDGQSVGRVFFGRPKV